MSVCVAGRQSLNGQKGIFHSRSIVKIFTMTNVSVVVEITLIEQEVANVPIQDLRWSMKEGGLELWGQECLYVGGGRRVHSEEGSSASRLASGSAVAGEGGGEGGEGGEAGCSWPSTLSPLSGVLLLPPAPSSALSPRRW